MKMKTKKLKDSDYAYYEEYIANKDKLIKVEANIIYLESNGYEFIKEDIKNSKVKIILKTIAGVTLIIYGSVTILLPTGSIFAIWTGLGLIVNAGIDYTILLRKLKWHFKTKRKMRMNQ